MRMRRQRTVRRRTSAEHVQRGVPRHLYFILILRSVNVHLRCWWLMDVAAVALGGRHASIDGYISSRSSALGYVIGRRSRSTLLLLLLLG